MGEAITHNADRDALLSYLDLKGALDAVAREYLATLGPVVVAQSMKAMAEEIYACAHLPPRGEPETKDTTQPKGSDK